MIKDFFERNKSVFIIGLVTLVIFLSIIVVSEIRRIRGSSFGPEMIRVEGNFDTDVKESTETSGIDIDDESDIEGAVTESSYSLLPDEKYLQTDQQFGIMKIEYTNNGFSPLNAKAVLNQKVRWINKTDQSVYIKQTASFFKEFKEPMLLPANGILEFRMYREGIWSYEEQTTKRFGSIIILKP